ncbi:MAG: hypothetical protein KME55_21740 [Nostoc indistinguendum CM1-VF10]|nr:hypothetical protein [Nostoc indistinguendum CM1-VF10]
MTRFPDPATVPKCLSYLYFAITPHLKNYQRSREQCLKWVLTHNRKNDVFNKALATSAKTQLAMLLWGYYQPQCL